MAPAAVAAAARLVTPPGCRASVLSPFDRSKSNQQKAVASVTASVLPNKNQVLSNASVSCVGGQEGSREGGLVFERLPEVSTAKPKSE